MLTKKTSFIYKNNKAIWICGKHSVISILKNNRRRIHQVVFTNYKLMEEFDHLINKNVKVKIEKSNYLDNIFSGTNHQNCAVEVEPLEQPSLNEIINISPSCLIILDQVTDPHNVGAIIRSAAAFSASAVVTTNDNSPSENYTLLKSASGNFELVPYIKIVNLSNTLQFLKENNYWCIGLDVETNQYIDSINLPNKVAFIIGSEDAGLRRLTKKNCDILIKLKISNQVESLNVSNAAAITLYEYRKQFKL